MLKNRKKKAFTIVELVIVIAVIAVLAAVLIPTFSNVIDKANTSADVNVVRNLNMILSSEAATEGKNATMTDALKDAEENGYTVEKLTPTNANNEILWDSVNDCFALKEKNATELNYCGVTPKETNVEDYQYFKIYNTKRPLTFKADGSVESDYSIYLGEGATSATELKVSKGIDVGENTGITSITYENNSTQDVVIRTNSHDTVLTINAPLDAVAHYDKAKFVDIIAVDGASYHEYGEVSTIKIASGRVVVENVSTANVSSVYIVPAQAGNANEGVKVEVKKQQDTPVAINKDPNVSADKILEVKNNNETVTPVTAIEVSDLETLKAALEGPVNGTTYETIYLAADIDLKLGSISDNYGILINKSIAIYGNGYRLYNTDNITENNVRLIQIRGIRSGAVVLDDVSIESNTYGSYFRGINIYQTENLSICLNKVTVSIPHYYAINIATENTNLKISMDNCEVYGWATVYNHSCGVVLTANNSIFDSVNPTLGGGETNSFGSIIVAEYYNWNESGDSNLNNFTFNNCSFSASKKNPDANVNQVICDIRSPYKNTVNFNNCEFGDCASPEYIRCAIDTEFEDSSDKRNEMYNTNKVFVNGIDVTHSADYIENYLDE